MSDEPDIKFAGFSLWIIGRQFPKLEDYWDGNWVNVRLEMEASEATVRAHGPIIHLPEIEYFAAEVDQLNTKLVGTAELKCLEPNLSIKICGGGKGQMTATIKITPDHMTQEHSFIVEVDQTYLSPLLMQCRKLLAEYPIKGVRDGKAV